MAETVKCPEQFVFGLDIGTRSIVGTIGYMDSYGFHVIAMDVVEHQSRAMLDGQVHDIGVVGEEIKTVKTNLENKIGRKLTGVCIAAAGRVLKTVTVKADYSLDPEVKITNEDVYNLELAGVETAYRKVNEENDGVNYYCVGYTPVKYFLNNYEIGNLEGHKGSEISVDLLATFLPEEVIDGLYAAVEYAGLEVSNLTLEPIAAMNVAIPEHYRLLNIALVDVGAGTSDICITKDGSVIAYGMIPSAGDEISETLAKKYLVDFATAEKIKLAIGKSKVINFKDIMGTKISIQPSDALSVAEPVIDRITKEVSDKITELNGGKPVNAIFVVGGGGKIPLFTEFLAKEQNLPKERVALRGKEVLENIEFAVNNVKKDPLFVTPVGICINYYNQKNNFISVTVNGKKIKLYDNSKLTVIDAIMSTGYPNELLFPRRGPEVNYTLNGIPRMIRGLAGEPAKIYRNGKEATLTSEIMKNDYIDIEESTVGEPVQMQVKELTDYNSSVSFIVNGATIVCPRYAYVNNELVNGDYIIKEGDKVVMEEFYSIEQLFEFMDVPVDHKNIMVNNEPADAKTKVYANFNVRYEDIIVESPITSEDVLDEENVEESVEESVEPKSPAVGQIHKAYSDADGMLIYVNGTPVTLKGKTNYLFVDILDFYPFDMSKMGGDSLIMTVDGVKAEFVTPLYPGAQTELRWC